MKEACSRVEKERKRRRRTKKKKRGTERVREIQGRLFARYYRAVTECKGDGKRDRQ